MVQKWKQQYYSRVLFKARLNLSYVLIALNVLQVLAGCLLTGGAVYVCLAVTKHLYAEKAEIRFVFTVFALFGTHIIIHYMVGIKMVELCFIKAHKRSTKRNFYFWLVVTSNTILDLLVLSSLIIKISKHIVRSIRHSMEKGMRHYLTDPIWKHTMDRWQFSLRCCGVNHFKDWHVLSWLDKYHINLSSPTVHGLLLDKDHVHLPITPWSCCNIHFPMQCLHDPIQQIDSAHLWKEQPDLIEMSLNKRGCLDVIRYPIEMALVAFLITCIVLFVNQVAIIIVSRFLYTSCRNAVVLRDTSGPSPGWLFGRNGLAGKRNRPVPEILMDLQYKSESEFVYTDTESGNKYAESPTPSIHANEVGDEEPLINDGKSSESPPVPPRHSSKVAPANEQSSQRKPSQQSHNRNSRSFRRSSQYKQEKIQDRASQTYTPVYKQRDKSIEMLMQFPHVKSQDNLQKKRISRETTVEFKRSIVDPFLASKSNESRRSQIPSDPLNAHKYSNQTPSKATTRQSKGHSSGLNYRKESKRRHTSKLSSPQSLPLPVISSHRNTIDQKHATKANERDGDATNLDSERAPVSIEAEEELMLR